MKDLQLIYWCTWNFKSAQFKQISDSGIDHSTCHMRFVQPNYLHFNILLCKYLSIPTIWYNINLEFVEGDKITANKYKDFQVAICPKQSCYLCRHMTAISMPAFVRLSSATIVAFCLCRVQLCKFDQPLIVQRGHNKE